MCCKIICKHWCRCVGSVTRCCARTAARSSPPSVFSRAARASSKKTSRDSVPVANKKQTCKRCFTIYTQVFKHVFSAWNWDNHLNIRWRHLGKIPTFWTLSNVAYMPEKSDLRTTRQCNILPSTWSGIRHAVKQLKYNSFCLFHNSM